MSRPKKEIITIEIAKYVGSFAENKDTAKRIRLECLFPALEKDAKIILDFSGVDSTTQSFIHALISEAIRRYSVVVIDKISFKDCNEKVKKIISIVVRYMQHSENPFSFEEQK